MSPVLRIAKDVNTELLCLWNAYLPRAHLRVFSRVSRVSAKPNASVFSFITYRPMTSHFFVHHANRWSGVTWTLARGYFLTSICLLVSHLKPMFRNFIFTYQSLSEIGATSEPCKSTSTWSEMQDDEHLLYNLGNYFDFAQEHNFELGLNFSGFSI